ncbi:MAG TPA: dihydropteroate synthase [Nitrolancea sp.]|jgi:dihydropteroate synthase|nr:dihydropteroate synthase [Nitrolancea sp.]
MPEPETLQVGSLTLAWGTRTYLMGIVNVTPDSFSGDGLADHVDEAVARARAMDAEGADIIDLGAESTRPGHTPVPPDEQLRRLMPVLTELAGTVRAPISIDTSSAKVARTALDAGASIVNDIRGLMADPEIANVAAEANAPVVIMHDLKIHTAEELIPNILEELQRRIEHALAAGIPLERIIVDPGFGFGKVGDLNLLLLRRLRELTVLGRPILSGTSRKSMIAHVLDLPAKDRLEGTAATVTLSIANGADIVRVHDVRAMSRVARMTDAVVRG